ncbi:hypothetical protein [Rhodococcus qingshengii]|uniref:Uncharacterized protein n=2 Tax=Rhodococcus erythropolis group TaxID=2840174 RepID=A0AAW6LLH2_RHOSG|nr:hypothetical protein [Rhodococcus qingshengii]MDE8647579.1 hypothetical protein [Rhodococcus qingshengii]
MASLNDQMELGHVIEVTAKGEILDSYDAYVESSVEQPLDSNGDAIGEPEPPSGWTFLRGFSGQQSYSGPVLHTSEFVAGGLEKHIRENPGLYVALSVEATEDGEDESTGVGWVVAHKPAN